MFARLCDRRQGLGAYSSHPPVVTDSLWELWSLCRRANPCTSWGEPLMRLPPSVHERVPARPLTHGVRDLGRDSLDVSAIRAIDAAARGVPP